MSFITKVLMVLFSGAMGFWAFLGHRFGVIVIQGWLLVLLVLILVFATIQIVQTVS